jgi:predicted nucleic acid-binding protein
MTSLSLQYVVDASVAIKLFIEQPMTDKAVLLFAQLKAFPSAQFYVPDLFFIECANVLWQYVRRTSYPAEEARQSITRLKQFGLEITSTLDLLPDALELAIAQQISAYDACYLVLAQRLGVELITADQKLVQALSGENYPVLFLGQWMLE